MIAAVSVVMLVATERLLSEQRQPHYEAKIAAAKLARDGMEAIKEEKIKLGMRIDPQVDPAETGMIGESVTSVTSNTGFLSAKRTSTNPNFAAVIVHLLKEAGVAKGDAIAVATSGSFPSLNLCVYAAIETLELEPVIIASTSSSEWGANHPTYLWLDMERTLAENKLISFRSAAASRGGIDDRGVGITKSGLALIDAAIERNELEAIIPESLGKSVEQRMAIYTERSGGKRFAAYINVGGGSASVGTHVGKKKFKPGLNERPPRGADIPDSVMLRFAKRDVPLVHISRIRLLAERYGLPVEPLELPPIGQGSVYITKVYNKWIAAGGIIAIVLALLGFIRLDFGVRILRGARPSTDTKSAEPMV